MGMTVEADFAKAFRDHFDRYGGEAKPIVAGIYAAGHADSLLITKTGVFIPCEFKVWRNVAPPATWEQVHALLDPRQANYIGRCWQRNGFVPVVAFNKIIPNYCHVISGGDKIVHTLEWQPFAMRLALGLLDRRNFGHSA